MASLYWHWSPAKPAEQEQLPVVPQVPRPLQVVVALQ
jgi:hypothetical protein